MSVSVICPACARSVLIEPRDPINGPIPCPECGRDLTVPDVPPVEAKVEAQETADQLLKHFHLHGLLLIPLVLLIQAAIRRIPSPISNWFKKAPTSIQALAIVAGTILVGSAASLALIALLPPARAPVAPPTDRTFRTTTCALTTPLAWSLQPGPHPQTDIQVSSPRQEATVYVVVDEKIDLDAGITLAQFARLRLQGVVDRFEKATVVKGPEASMIGGRNAFAYEVHGTQSDKKRVVMLIAYVEGTDAFFQVVALAAPSKIDAYRAALDGIIASFREIAKQKEASRSHDPRGAFGGLFVACRTTQQSRTCPPGWRQSCPSISDSRLSLAFPSPAC